MRYHNLRLIITLSLFLVLLAAPALQALPLQRPAEVFRQSPMFGVVDWLARLAERLGWMDAADEPARRAVVASDEEGGTPPPPTPDGDDGMCTDPDGHRVPCTP